MSWLSTTTQEANTQNTDNIWLKFEQLTRVDEKSEITLRILGGDPTNEAEPVGVWVHWLNSKPYNCAGFDDCPVCQARKQAMRDDPQGYKKKFQIVYKYFFNVLVDEGGPVVKIFSFGGGLGKNLKAFQEEYGDLRTYDIKVRKTKTGNRQQDVEYDAFVQTKRLFDDATIEANKANMHDLKQFTQPANIADLQFVARGEIPVNDAITIGKEPTAELLVKLEDIVAARQMTLGDLEVTPATSKARLEELISLLAPND
jgi:hypothetical protein